MALFGRKKRGAVANDDVRSDMTVDHDIVVEIDHMDQDVVVDLTERSPRSGLRWKDLMVFSEVIDSGADMTQPHHLSYVMFFDTKKVADKAATRGRRSGYEVSLVRPDNGSPYRWRATFEWEAVLDLREVISADDFFQGIAGELGGHFHGLEVNGLIS